MTRRSELRELNERTGVHRFNVAANGVVYTLNCLMGVAGLVLVVVRLFVPTTTLPALLGSYDAGPQVAVNAVFMLVLNNAYERYYDLYTRAVELRPVGGAVDVVIKGWLIAGSALLLVFPEQLIPVTTVFYLLTLVRNLELRRSTPRDHPVWQEMNSAWLPNNIRHNLVLVTTLAAYVAVATGAVFWVGQWLLLGTLRLDASHRAVAAALAAAAFNVWFALYWTVRIQRKVVTRPHRHLTPEGMRALNEQIEDYLEQRAGTQGTAP